MNKMSIITHSEHVRAHTHARTRTRTRRERHTRSLYQSGKGEAFGLGRGWDGLGKRQCWEVLLLQFSLVSLGKGQCWEVTLV
jgi:hypothetical protein